MCQQTESAWPPARGPTPNFEHLSKGPDFLSGYGILLDDCMSALVDHAYLVAGSIGMPQEDPMLLSAEGTLLVGLAAGENLDPRFKRCPVLPPLGHRSWTPVS